MPPHPAKLRHCTPSLRHSLVTKACRIGVELFAAWWKIRGRDQFQVSRSWETEPFNGLAPSFQLSELSPEHRLGRPICSACTSGHRYNAFEKDPVPCMLQSGQISKRNKLSSLGNAQEVDGALWAGFVMDPLFAVSLLLGAKCIGECDLRRESRGKALFSSSVITTFPLV